MEMTGAGSMVNTLASLSPLTHLSLVIRSFVRSFVPSDATNACDGNGTWTQVTWSRACECASNRKKQKKRRRRRRKKQKERKKVEKDSL